jgi:hypothetical protein
MSLKIKIEAEVYGTFCKNFYLKKKLYFSYSRMFIVKSYTLKENYVLRAELFEIFASLLVARKRIFRTVP